jgi:hypothetical protein
VLYKLALFGLWMVGDGAIAEMATAESGAAQAAATAQLDIAIAAGVMRRGESHGGRGGRSARAA